MCFIFKIICLSCFQVITKFIQKQKVHQQSWVDDPTLGRKVPLEISLLTTLKHPNIVSIRISVCRSTIHQCLNHYFVNNLEHLKFEHVILVGFKRRLLTLLRPALNIHMPYLACPQGQPTFQFVSFFFFLCTIAEMLFYMSFVL